MNQFLTSKERIALNIIFARLGESLFNRTTQEYRNIALRLPKLEAMHARVNEVLRRMADAKIVPYEICYFRPGDRAISYVPFPTSLSRETVRRALHKSGMFALRDGLN
jgi:hypothetical protein